jgi:hypothetical protein
MKVTGRARRRGTGDLQGGVELGSAGHAAQGEGRGIMRLLLLRIASCAAVTALITMLYGEQLQRVPRFVDVMLVLLMGSLLFVSRRKLRRFRRARDRLFD